MSEVFMLRKAFIAAAFFVCHDPPSDWLQTALLTCPADEDLSSQTAADRVVQMLAQEAVSRGHDVTGWEIACVTMREISADELQEAQQHAQPFAMAEAYHVH